jgi:hypothetical protein
MKPRGGSLVLTPTLLRATLFFVTLTLALAFCILPQAITFKL